MGNVSPWTWALAIALAYVRRYWIPAVLILAAVVALVTWWCRRARRTS